MKKIFIIAAAVATLAACQKNSPVEIINNPADDNAIGFSAYTATAVTKGTQVVADDLKGTGDEKGIGVFAFYQPAVGGLKSNFSTRKYAVPDFMYNQQVTTEDGNTWTYTPIKYWPNNVNDQLSFFAYAPHNATCTWEDLGITTDVNGTELTKVFVIESNPKDQVDFLWTKPQINLTKQSVQASTGTAGKDDTPIKFQFKHVLSQVNLQIGVEKNNDQQSPTAWGDTDTKIEVNSIVFKNAYETITYKSSTDKWTGEGSQDIVMTKDNFQNFTSTDWTAAQFYNLTKAGSSLFIAPQKSGDQDGDQDMDIVITYTVTTTDANLPDGKSVVTNVITKKLSEYATGTLANGFEEGKSYLLKFLIGMNKVSIVADVTAWENGGEQQIDVPANE